MIPVVHRINTRSALSRIPPSCGVEIDLRAYGSELILHHEPFTRGERFEDYLEEFSHRFLIANIKDSGIELDVIRLLENKGIVDYFLLDVEFPFVFQAINKKIRNLALRFSEKEPIESVELLGTHFDWVWIDTLTRLPIDSHSRPILSKLKTCLVCPERWGRPEDIPEYRAQFARWNWYPDAVMTSEATLERWFDEEAPYYPLV